jgi:hypothetical protein
MLHPALAPNQPSSTDYLVSTMGSEQHYMSVLIGRE